jgi:Na+-transporting NADH:ubiquinone oxidoreductase subunit B
MQKPMIRVCFALMPLVIASVYLFGLRSLALVLVVLIFGIITEAMFTTRRGKPISSAVFVTCLIFSLSLPPKLPFWMSIVGIVVGVAIGKMAFGGFGQNVFNPAMVGRCFLYVTFPIEMTNIWVKPTVGGIGGFAFWSAQVDAITRATPLTELRKGVTVPLQDLLFGNTAGSLGEMSAILIIIGGAYIIYKKAAPWRLAASCLLGGLILSSIFYGFEIATAPTPMHTLLSGSFLFGTAFVVTEPISGAKTTPGQWIYGFLVGSITIVLRNFSNFPEGIMFSVLIMNAFVPLIDRTVRQIQTSKKLVEKVSQ